MQYVAQIQDDGKTITLLIKQGNNKEAVARLRRLMNTNFKDNSVNVELSYKTKTEAR